MVNLLIDVSTVTISTTLLQILLLFFESAGLWTCFFFSELQVTGYQGSCLKACFSVSKMQVGIKKTTNCKRDQRITASGKCLHYLTLFKKLRQCLFHKGTPQCPGKQTSAPYFFPPKSGQYSSCTFQSIWRINTQYI